MPVWSSEGNTSKNCTEFHPDKHKGIVTSTKFTRSLIAETTFRNLNNIPALIFLTLIYSYVLKLPEKLSSVSYAQCFQTGSCSIHFKNYSLLK